MKFPQPSIFFWQITAVIFICVTIVQHFTVATLTDRLGLIESTAEFQGGWVYFPGQDKK